MGKWTMAGSIRHPQSPSGLIDGLGIITFGQDTNGPAYFTLMNLVSVAQLQMEDVVWRRWAERYTRNCVLQYD